MAQLVWRTEVMETKAHPALKQLCHQTKNLYNRAMFLFKQHYTQTKKHLSYQQLDRILKKEECYRVLPVHTAQHTIKVLTRNWKSFIAALKAFQINPKAFYGHPKPPKYKAKNGQQIAIFTNQQAKIRNKQVVLPKKVQFAIKTRLPDHVTLREIRVIPRAIGYSVEVVYNKLVPEINVKGKNVGAIDLGIVNLLTYVDNIGNRPIVVKDEGKGVKSICHFYLKEVKRLRQRYAKQQQQQPNQKNKLLYGKKFYHLRETKRRKVNNWIHQVSKQFVDLWDQTGITKVFVGYNPGWKQQLRLRKKTTQMFVLVPFDKIINALKYKAEERGIEVKRLEEDYTSKCSFLDNEYPKKRRRYKGKRVKRGMFRAASGTLINADVNGAFNIMLLGDPQALPKRSVDGVGGYVIYPLRWRFEQ